MSQLLAPLEQYEQHTDDRRGGSFTIDGAFAERIDLSPRVAARLTELGPAIGALGLTLGVSAPHAVARGDAALLGWMVDELLLNGVRHNALDGWLHVTTETLAGRAVLRVANGGPHARSLAAESLRGLLPAPRIGFGSGLGIVRTIVAAHRGTLWVSAPPSGGLAVEVELPGEPAFRAG
jgi:two-component system sensor histidine kinase VanS